MRPDLVEPTMRESLQNLGLEYLDLYLIHWPAALKVIFIPLLLCILYINVYFIKKNKPVQI